MTSITSNMEKYIKTTIDTEFSMQHNKIPNYALYSYNATTAESSKSTKALIIKGLKMDADEVYDYINEIDEGLTVVEENVDSLNKQCEAFDADIKALKTAVATNTSDIATLKTAVATNTSDISTLKTSVGALQTSVNANTSNISALQTSVSTLQTSVGTNTSAISDIRKTLEDIASRLEALESPEA